MVCIINIQNAYVIWDELIKKACDHEQKNLGSYLPTYLLKPITYIHLPILNLATYLTYVKLPILAKPNLG